jgi:hypothetical protein
MQSRLTAKTTFRFPWSARVSDCKNQGSSIITGFVEVPLTIVGEKFHLSNQNGKKQGCLTCPSPYTLLCAFGLFFMANVGQTAFQLCCKVCGLHGDINWLARFFSEPDVEFLGRSSDESTRPMNRHSLRCPSLDNRNRFTKESGDLLPAFQRLGLSRAMLPMLRHNGNFTYRVAWK